SPSGSRQRSTGRMIPHSDKHSPHSGKQSLEFFLDAPIALADSSFQSAAVQNLNLTAMIMDQPSLLKELQYLGHARAPDPKHVGQKLMGEGKLVARGSIGALQEPTAAALGQGMQAVAGRRLHDLLQKGIYIEEKQS